MNPHILSLSPADVVLPVYEHLKEEMQDHTLEFLLPRSQEHLRERLGAAEFVLGDWTHVLRMGPPELEAARRCRLIVQPTAGFDSIDVVSARERGIPVANCPGANARAVAEWAVMAILVALKNAVANHERTRRGEWWMTKALEEGIYDIGDRTVGILGFGTIGQEVARRLHGFGVTILYQDAFVTTDLLDDRIPVEQVESVDELCRRSDILSVHVPLTPHTRHLVNAERIALLGEQGVLVNCSRGPVVDEDALLHALRSRTIKAAALDVFEEEPIPVDHRWRDEPNVFLSPHISGGTVEARDRMVGTALRTIDDAMRGTAPRTVVNDVTVLR